MIPESLPTRLPRPVARVWRSLRKINNEDLVCRISYALDGEQRPEFMVTCNDRFVFLLAISSAGDEQVESMLQTELYDGQALVEQLSLREQHNIERFVTSVLETSGAANAAAAQVQKWLLFPYASTAHVKRLAEVANWPDYSLFGREDCTSEALSENFQRHSHSPLGEILLRTLQGRFNPESTIPLQWIPQERAVPLLEPRQTDYLLDFDQEAALKRDLELSAEAQEAAEAGSLRLVTGVAGCGKTLILLLRARMTAMLRPGARVLVLMHNRALRADLAARARELEGGIDVEWETFMSWIRRFLSYDVPPPWEISQLIETVKAASSTGTELSPRFLGEEFSWIADNAVEPPTLEWYLEVDRVGRQRALQQPQRKVVFELFRAYRRRLKQRRITDWSGVPQAFLRALEEGRIKPPSYDAIYIDEAQFFAPVWFACVRRVLRPERGQLFMAADPTQGFLRQGQSWSRVLGREVRGRSQRLERPYRNTREIMAFAKRYYLSRVPAEEDEVNLPSEDFLQAMPQGSPPRFCHTPTHQDERTMVAKEVSKALSEGLAPGGILIIHSDQRQAMQILNLLSVQHPHEVADAREAESRGKVRVCSLNGCTGLEAPIVILCGLDALCEEEQGLDLDPDERRDLIRSNTKRVFVGITRATRRLLICYHTETTKAMIGAEAALA